MNLKWWYPRRPIISLQQLRKLFGWEQVPEQDLLSAYQDMKDASDLEDKAIQKFKGRKGKG